MLDLFILFVLNTLIAIIHSLLWSSNTWKVTCTHSHFNTFTHRAIPPCVIHTGTYIDNIQHVIKQVGEMTNHINGIKFITAFKKENIANYYLPFTLNQAIVLESARSHESLFVDHLIQQIQI